MSGWRPISTAPKDAQIMIYMPNAERKVAEAYCCRMGYCWVQGYQPPGTPTMWQPLPTPPAQDPRA